MVPLADRFRFLSCLSWVGPLGILFQTCALLSYVIHDITYGVACAGGWLPCGRFVCVGFVSGVLLVPLDPHWCVLLPPYMLAWVPETNEFLGLRTTVPSHPVRSIGTFSQ